MKMKQRRCLTPLLTVAYSALKVHQVLVKEMTTYCTVERVTVQLGAEGLQELFRDDVGGVLLVGVICFEARSLLGFLRTRLRIRLLPPLCFV